jgi:hypothetical protein
VRVNGTGLRFLPVPHEGNQNAAIEEADCIRDLVFEILAANPKWIDRKGETRAVGLADILIIAPYNGKRCSEALLKWPFWKCLICLRHRASSYPYV